MLTLVEPIPVTLITRHDCHLCDDMAGVIAEVGRTFAIDLEVRDVDADPDPDLLRLYSDEVPVLLIAGRKAFKYRVTPRELARRLRDERRRTGQH